MAKDGTDLESYHILSNPLFQSHELLKIQTKILILVLDLCTHLTLSHKNVDDLNIRFNNDKINLGPSLEHIL